MNYWGCVVNLGYSGCLFRLCTPLGSDKILRGNSNYKSFFRFPLFWSKTGSLAMGRLRGG